MSDLVERIEKTLFTARDTVCLERAQLVTEAYRLHAAEAVPVRRAKAFEHVLRHMSLDLLSNPVFAGNTSSAPRAWMLVPEFCLDENAQVVIEHSELEGFLEGKVPVDIRTFWQDRAVGNTSGGPAGLGHMSLDYDFIVNRGLNDALERLERHRCDGSSKNQCFREAMAIAVRAVIAWAERYAEEAERIAEQTDDSAVSTCLRRIAQACRHVPAHPARNLFEALQAIALVHLATVLEGQGMSISVGLPDRVLARFSAEAEANPGEAVLLCRAFILKIAANSLLGRGNKSQTITVGGAGLQGDVCNAVTLAFLDAFARTPVSDPQLFLRWHEGTNETAWQRALEMLSNGRSMPMLVNDHQVAPALIEAGVDPEDAWDYCIVGCNELAIPGRCSQTGVSEWMGFNDLQIIDRVTRDLAGQQVTVSAILGAYENAVHERATNGLQTRRKRLRFLADTVPFPFCSACCQSCIERGEDLLFGQPYSVNYGLFLRGTTNAINALAAVEALVTEGGGYTLPELLAGIGSQDPGVLAEIARAPKWGNDDPRADRLGVALSEHRDRALRRAAQEEGVPPFAVCHVVRSLHHLDGRSLEATLDGRAPRSPVGDSVGPIIGTQTEGPTAMLNSVLKLQAGKWFTGIYNLNLTLPAGAQADIPVVRSLADTFFQQGGQELQINVLDAEKLRRAQRHPERYPDLVVRVAGLNARFIELSTLEQEELIRRADVASGIPGDPLPPRTRR